MAEYIVKGAEPNETVLHTRTPNGYEEWRWLFVREQVVRCKDCKHSLLSGTECQFFSSYEPIEGGDEYEQIAFSTDPDGFCAWGRRAE